MSLPEHERGPAPTRTGPTRCDAAPRQNVVTERTPVAGQPVPEELRRRRDAGDGSEPLSECPRPAAQGADALAA